MDTTKDNRNHCEDRQKALSVAYLGPPASFSHQAALAVFPSANLIPLPSFTSIFDSLERGFQPEQNGVGVGGEEKATASSSPSPAPSPALSIDFVVLPIENSTNGSIVQASDLLAQCTPTDSSSSNDGSGGNGGALYPNLEICEEYYLPVHHYVYTSPNTSSSSSPSSPSSFSNIKVLYTHPQVWTQCSKYLAQHFPHAERFDVASTSAAATVVSKDSSGSSAAICSQLAGQGLKLKCLAEQIEDEPGRNTTRFYVLRNRRAQHQQQQSLQTLDLLPSRRCFVRQHQQPPNQDREVQEKEDGEKKKKVNTKALVLFTIKHAVTGSLSNALQVFAKHGLNLTRIDSRPHRSSSSSNSNSNNSNNSSNESPSWQYIFLVECEEKLPVKDVMIDTAPTATSSTASAGGGAGGGAGGSKLPAAIKELQGLTEHVTCLGRWIDMLQDSSL